MRIFNDSRTGITLMPSTAATSSSGTTVPGGASPARMTRRSSARTARWVGAPRSGTSRATSADDVRRVGRCGPDTSDHLLAAAASTDGDRGR